MSDGYYYLDGGLWNNLPVTHLPDVDLVIAVYYEPITRFFFEQRRPERFKNIIFVKPSSKLPISTWDYTNPFGVRATYELGKQAGEKALEQIKAAV